MPSTSKSGTAKIHQFPARPVAGTLPRTASDLGFAPQAGTPCEAASGGGWYHDAAIRDETPARKP